MKNSTYVINNRAKNRATKYLKQLIRNKGIVRARANSNISAIQSYLNEFGIDYKIVSKKGYKSIVTKKSQILLNSHVDVVPGRAEQFIPKIFSNKMYGRGAADALGCAVSMIVCAQELKTLDKNVGLMIVSDEEAGGLYGTKHILENYYDKAELENIKY
ncbi:MAG: M20/M25/M40 family metallo-hydrolase, partial [bacterium]